MMFAMVGGERGSVGSKDESEMVPGTDGRLVENQCYICHKKGHFSWYCPEAGNTGPPLRDKKNLNCTQFGFVQQSTDGKGVEIKDAEFGQNQSEVGFA